MPLLRQAAAAGAAGVCAVAAEAARLRGCYFESAGLVNGAG